MGAGAGVLVPVALEGMVVVGGIEAVANGLGFWVVLAKLVGVMAGNSGVELFVQAARSRHIPIRPNKPRWMNV